MSFCCREVYACGKVRTKSVVANGIALFHDTSYDDPTPAASIGYSFVDKGWRSHVDSGQDKKHHPSFTESDFIYSLLHLPGAAITRAIFCFPRGPNWRYKPSVASRRRNWFPRHEAADDKSRRNYPRSGASEAE